MTQRASAFKHAARSFSLVPAWKLTRKLCEASSRVTPIARSTCEGSAAPLAHALPTDTATPGADYTPSSGPIVFVANSANNSTRTFTVPVFNDTLDENDETFTVTLSGDAVGNPASQVVTIADDDPPPVISINNCSVTEGTG